MPVAGGKGSLHRLDAKEPRRNVSKEHPALTKRMRKLTRGLYEAARYITNNNPRLEGEEATIARAVK
jgi:hypothetical protein